MSIAIKTKVHNLCIYVIMNKSEIEQIELFLSKGKLLLKFGLVAKLCDTLRNISYTFYVFVALLAHGIAAEDAIEVKVFDHTRTPLDQECFPIVVNQFQNCSDFLVEIIVDTQGAYQITKDVRRHFFFVSYFRSNFHFILCDLLLHLHRIWKTIYEITMELRLLKKSSAIIFFRRSH